VQGCHSSKRRAHLIKREVEFLDWDELLRERDVWHYVAPKPQTLRFSFRERGTQLDRSPRDVWWEKDCDIECD